MGAYDYRELLREAEIRILTLLGEKESRILAHRISRDPKNDIFCLINHKVLKTATKPRLMLPLQRRTTITDHVRIEVTPFEYEAVSWTWGDDKNERSIFILDDSEDATKWKTATEWKTVSVRFNLITVLKNLRNKEQPRYLWVDGICVNQKNPHELGLQVAMMADIYSNARNVCVCLGDHKDDSEVALDFVSNRLRDLGAFEEMVADPQFSKQWISMAALMNRDWFRRRWIVQEIAHARSATVHCGRDFVEWADFETAVSLFEQDAPRISKLFENSAEKENDRDFFGNVEAMGAVQLVNVKSRLFRRDDDLNIFEYLYTLSELVTELPLFEAQNGHDLIYAVLSLAKDTHGKVKAKAEAGKAVQANTAAPQSTPFATRSNTNGASETQARMNSNNINLRDAGPIAESPIDVQADGFMDAISHQPPSLSSRKSVESFKSALSRHPSSLSADSIYLDSRKPSIPITEGDLGNEKAEFLLKKTWVNRWRQNTKKREFIVDYEQPFFDVCKQFLNFAFEDAAAVNGNNLDILCLPWAPTVDEELPSWIPSVKEAPCDIKSAKHAPGGEKISRKNPDPLVQFRYNACGMEKASKWRFGDPTKGEHEHSLFLYGILLDKIGKIEDSSQGGHVPLEWFELAGWCPWDNRGKRTSDANPPEHVWRTLVGDRGQDGASAKLYYKRAFVYAIDNSTRNAGLECQDLMNRSNSILVKFLKRMSAVVFNRRLFKSERGKLLGLAPKKADRDDWICILRGCSVPVVLRKAANGSHYKFLGACYLHTMMDGKGIDIQGPRNKWDFQELELR